MGFTGIERHISAKIQKLVTLFPVVAILGVRQAGKTSLVKALFPNWHYVDLEDSEDFDRVSYDVKFFLRQNPHSVIIDEAQEYPELFRNLRGSVDTRREQNGRYILTGSSNPTLLKQISESLAGRIAIIELGTLKASELYQLPLSPLYRLFQTKLHKNNLVTGEPPLTLQQIQQAWLKGGYPQPVLAKDPLFYPQWMENYQNTYLNRDIAKLFPRLNKTAYRRFIHVLGKLAGTILNKRDLGRALEISEKTVSEYLSIAAGTYVWHELKSYEKNALKSVIKMPKGYYRDTGLLHSLLKINSLEDLFYHPMVGPSFEGFIIEEIMKGLKATMVTNWNAYYYRTRGGAEIDLILDGPFGLLPIEIKYGSTVKRTQLRSLIDFVKAHSLPFGMVINQSEKVEWLTEQIVQVPAGWV